MPDQADDTHITLLSGITSRLLDNACLERIKGAAEPEEILAALTEEKAGAARGGTGKFLIGVTGCTVGVAPYISGGQGSGEGGQGTWRGNQGGDQRLHWYGKCADQGGD